MVMCGSWKRFGGLACEIRGWPALLTQHKKVKSATTQTRLVLLFLLSSCNQQLSNQYQRSIANYQTQNCQAKELEIKTRPDSEDTPGTPDVKKHLAQDHCHAPIDEDGLTSTSMVIPRFRNLVERMFHKVDSSTMAVPPLNA